MLNFLKKEADITLTENGGITNASSLSDCLDLFFRAGAMRNADEKDIADAVLRAFAESPLRTMKIIFFARDVRGGLGERRFFRIAVKALAFHAPLSVEKNIGSFAEYGRYDDLLVLMDTPCESAAVKEISRQLTEDKKAYAAGGQVSLLAKWLPSVNASSAETRAAAKKLAKALSMSEKNYRHTLSALRKYTDIIENRLRVYDYTFDYAHQPSRALFKYRKAFIRNDGRRYDRFIQSVKNGEQSYNASTLYPYDIVRQCLDMKISPEERDTLDAAWNSLPDLTGSKNENAIAVIDGSGSMTWGGGMNVRPIDAALSLGIYFAEHSEGSFANHFITFSQKPRLVEIKGSDITEKTRYCATYNECANTDLEAVFDLILRTAVRNHLKKSDMPAKLYIISDMEFDSCIEGGNSLTMFNAMKGKYARYGYKLPQIVFWNVNSRRNNIPVTRSQTGAALVSGFSPAVFDMVMGGEISPEAVMNSVIGSERYSRIAA